MHFLRLVSRPIPQELEQELHAPHFVHSEGEWGSRKLKGGIRNKISSREVLGLDFYVFPNLTNFLFLFLCLFLPQIFLFFLSVQISEFKLVNVRFYISFQPAPHKLPPPFLFISWSIQPLWAGTLLYTPGRFSWGWSWRGEFIEHCSTVHTRIPMVLENIGISRCFL